MKSEIIAEAAAPGITDLFFADWAKTSDIDDAQFTAIATAATRIFENYARYDAVTRTRRFYFDLLPDGSVPSMIFLPFRPVASVSSVALMIDGVYASTDTTLYAVGNRARGKWYVALQPGKSWPPADKVLNAGYVEYVTGCDVSSVPADIQAAIAAIALKMNHARGDEATPQTDYLPALARVVGDGYLEDA
jgi:hypothetical protein